MGMGPGGTPLKSHFFKQRSRESTIWEETVGIGQVFQGEDPRHRRRVMTPQTLRSESWRQCSVGNTTLVPTLHWCQHYTRANTTLLLALHWCQHYTGADTTLVPTPHSCQHYTRTNITLVPTLHWCQHYTGADTTLVPTLHWYRHYTRANTTLVPTLHSCQHLAVLAPA